MMHRIEIRLPPETWIDDGEPDRFAMLLEFAFEEMGLGFSLDQGGPGYRLRVADLKRGLDVIVQQLRDADFPPETIVLAESRGKQGILLRLGDLARG